MFTVADVLLLPVVRSADPLLLAGRNRLDSPVSWVHTTELADIGPLLRGGDLVLTTGIAMPDAGPVLAGLAHSLVQARAAGLVVELGRRWSKVPAELVEACIEAELPLVALRREVRFAAVAQAVGEVLVEEQVRELRAAQQVHDTFTELSIREAGPDDILTAVQQLSGAPVVLESEDHVLLDYRAGPSDVQEFAADWTRRSRNAPEGRTVWDASNGWLVTRVGRRERGWGRLMIGVSGPPPARLVTVAERGAAALAMHRLHDRSRDGHIRRRHYELVLRVLSSPDDPETARRVGLAGVPVERHRYVGLALRPAADLSAASTGWATRLDEIVSWCLRVAEQHRTPCLVAALETDVRILLAFPPRVEPGLEVDRLAAALCSRGSVVVASGSPVPRLSSADRTLREAAQVMAVLPPGAATTVVHRLVDLHLRGLIAMVGNDERVRDFVERELAPLRQAAPTCAFDLLATTRVVIENWGSKTSAATALNISRTALYERIARIERVIGADLDDAERRASLHVALLCAENRPADR